MVWDNPCGQTLHQHRGTRCLWSDNSIPHCSHFWTSQAYRWNWVLQLKWYSGLSQRGLCHFCGGRHGCVTGTKPLASWTVHSRCWQGTGRHGAVVATAGYGQPQTILVTFIPYNQALPRHSSFHTLSQTWAKKAVGPHCSCLFPYCPGLLSSLYI